MIRYPPKLCFKDPYNESNVNRSHRSASKRMIKKVKKVDTKK